ncbi:MAG: hypothetical protein KIT85_17580 [Pseudolabrys sp.]|nr:hypothetical protein [Pseudolabrys sp.]MCW5686209.1 hypothetical protein [Pseudolabrys sp.]
MEVTMSDPNLNRPRPGEPLPGRASIDPNDPIPMEPVPRRDTSGSGMMWGWIAGIAVVVLILAFMFGGTNSQQTADTAPPAATPSRTTPAPSPPTAQRPTPQAPSTTGSGSSNQ